MEHQTNWIGFWIVIGIAVLLYYIFFFMRYKRLYGIDFSKPGWSGKRRLQGAAVNRVRNELVGQQGKAAESTPPDANGSGEETDERPSAVLGPPENGNDKIDQSAEGRTPVTVWDGALENRQLESEEVCPVPDAAQPMGDPLHEIESKEETDGAEKLETKRGADSPEEGESADIKWALQEFQAELQQTLSIHQRSGGEWAGLKKRLLHVLQSFPPYLREECRGRLSRLIVLGLEDMGLTVPSEEQMDEVWNQF